MTLAIANFLLKIFRLPEVVTVFMAVIPVIEVRGSIPFAMTNYEMGPFFAWLYSFLGSAAIVPLLLLVLVPFINLLRRTKAFRKVGDVLYEKFAKGARGISDKPAKNKTGRTADADLQTDPQKAAALAARRADLKKMLGVFLFVAIPLPLTGVWTGCAVAAVCGLSYTTAHRYLDHLVKSGLAVAVEVQQEGRPGRPSRKYRFTGMARSS